MARAVRLQRYGDRNVLEVVDVGEPPAPGPDQLVVRVRAAGINPGEAKIREGLLHDRYPATFPSGQGSDLAGIVEAVGEGVDGFTVGDEIIGWTDERGSHAEVVVIPAAQATPKPSGVSWVQAGAMFVAGATAWAAVRAVGVVGDDTIVVAGAAGGVGVIAVQLAAIAGARVIGLASEPHHGWLRDHGAIPVVYGEGVRDRIREAAPNGVDALLDFVGGGYVELGLSLGVAPGRIDTIVDFGAVQEHGVISEGSAAGSTTDALDELAALIEAGRLEIPIAATYPIDRVRDAYAELEEGHTLGKIVLTM
jgi:NADPH:quinone reductase-like Zn-dependent oxidoreductase